MDSSHIQSDCSKNSGEELTLTLMPPQTLSEYVQLKNAKNKKMQFWLNLELMLSKLPWGIIIENWKLLQ